MSSNVSTIDLQTESAETDASASGVCSGSFVKRLESPWASRRLGQIVGMVFNTAASPATAVPDYWFWERRRHDASTVAYIFERVIGRPISRAQALRIAAQILERAERERVELAEWEARCGIQWEEEE